VKHTPQCKQCTYFTLPNDLLVSVLQKVQIIILLLVSSEFHYIKMHLISS